MAKKSAPASKPVATHKHADTRPNIPTEELRDFVDPAEGQKKVLYPRDPSLDPQLVWRGKDEQDAAPLEVPAVPIYIQEKIHPQAIVEEFRRDAERARRSEGQAGEEWAAGPDLFADFNGLTDFARKVDFYHWEQHWSNRFILGDSLLVMTSLAEKEALKGRVQTIYFDPPYGIRFGSNWQVSTRKRDVKDGKAEDATRQPEQIRAFRDTWQLGIHSYLAYLRDRLVVARELLTESGSVFVQIGDENVHLVRCVMDEVFGSENFVSQIIFRKTTGKGGQYLDNTYDVLLWYAKDRERVKYRATFEERTPLDDSNLRFIELEDETTRQLTVEEIAGLRPLPEGSRVFRPNPLTNQRPAQGSDMREFAFHGKRFTPGGGTFRTDSAGMTRLATANRLLPVGNTLTFLRYLDDFPFKPRNDIWDDARQSGFGDPKVYVVQTATKVAERCLLMTTDPGDLVLDPTCGSGTTAYVAEQWGRRWITVDSSRVALTLARTRLMAARFPYYHLLDSPEGARLEMEQTGRITDTVGGRASSRADAASTARQETRPPGNPREGDLRKGFVYRRVPHVTLKAIANNEEIDALHAEWQPKIATALAALNAAAGTNWREWEVPRALTETLTLKLRASQLSTLNSQLSAFWRLRRERQRAMDASIARRAETEVLYDQPLEDAKRIRVTGPFTVESLSPHRTISVEEKKALAERGRDGVTIRTIGPDSFGNLILENLRTAGVQNTKKKERLKFDTLEPFTGEWLHGEGRSTEAGGTARRAAICIGPEHGTVGPELVKEAAKEAVRGVGFDLLLVCGFAFDPHISEEIKRYGKLTVLPVRMNPDLAMGELLKKTGAGNLFMVFGEPDVKLTTARDGTVTIELLGLDVYDPTTGEIRSSATDDIACWFLDTDYNGESFFVRHAYFTGADEPCEKLKRALRAEVDESAWSALYSTTSRPFPKPKSGKVAVKVINHYGDEVLKVFEVK